MAASHSLRGREGFPETGIQCAALTAIFPSRNQSHHMDKAYYFDKGETNYYAIPMRFEFRSTNDGSLTVFDREAGECFKSRHAAALEAECVFYSPGVSDNPWFGTAAPFRILELGFGLGTNFLHLAQKNIAAEFVSIERDMAGALFFLDRQPCPELAELAQRKTFSRGGFHARLIEGDFFEVLSGLNEKFHAIYFDPFSPKANPEAWTKELFEKAAACLVPEGRLVTYSVSRASKDAASAAGLRVEKHKLPPELNKRSALLAIKPSSEARASI